MVATALAGEQGITLSAAAELFPPGIPAPDVKTLRRWCTVGCRGVRLRHWRRGDRIFTSCEAVREFLEKVNET